MLLAKKIENIIYTLQYNTEYTYDIFGSINREVVKKTIQRRTRLVGKTTNGKFYRKFISDSKIANSPYLISDDTDIVLNNPKDYTFNAFWQSHEPRKQKVIAIIKNYLATMNRTDIYTLCDKFGVNRVKAVNVSYYKEIYHRGYLDIKGMKIPLTGRYDRNPSYKEIIGILNDY